MRCFWALTFVVAVACAITCPPAVGDDKDDEKVDTVKMAAALSKATVSLAQAFETASKQVPDGKVIGGEVESDGAKVTLDVDVLKDGAQVEVSLDAITGKVISSGPEKLDGKEAKEFEEAKKVQPQLTVSLGDAVARAEKAVPGSKAFEVALELEDGKPIINVSVLAGNKASGVDIDGRSGKVTEIEKLPSKHDGKETKEGGAAERKGKSPSKK